MNEFLLTGIQLSYLVAASLFIFGLKKLGSPATARNGNLLAAIGMLIAVVATLLDRQVLNYQMILLGIAIGSAIGAIAARAVAMTAMPQMVGFLNGLGGAASALVAIGEFWRLLQSGEGVPLDATVTVILGILIGGVTLTGSLIAVGKLQGIIDGKPIQFPLQQLVNALLLICFVVLGGYLFVEPGNQLVFLGAIAVSAILGVLFVLPIGGGDMPVVISLLNSFSGLAASAAGFVVMNNMLIIAGALVGASGLILTDIMCKGMNRTLTNVIFGAFGGGSTTGGAGGGSGAATDQVVRTVGAEEAAMMLGYARNVVIVPGYGMAVAQAQHAVKELCDQLEKLGVEVKYAIHPVAGRMPGHMNVLLAEANVPYPQLYDMDDINPQFEQTDVALIIGANDVVNPSARHDSGSPIYGMPILEVDKAKNAIVIKRGMGAGFSGVQNELFFKDKTMMLFGSAKDAVAQLASEVKQL
ncbi:MAG: NAD(P)(+) transhydrogenase (Re/Si-specific) subunit beta [Oscillatoria sp. PMC 1068.18]|nr:NAD(P)(+) transhydrogenase (Re/Si-specific) subunit beta [Oscillatoria sp. PMC 1076.18]MEC4990098.1 NAD(P)(+) transhydrogenase (Re/Si-specific) subunit beta [Oscillatoria sp. PMC 1068.18]